MQNGLKRMKENKTLVLKEKYLLYENIEKNARVFNGNPCKNVTKYFCIFFHFREFCIFFSFSEEKKPGYGQRVPPPLVYGLVLTYSCFFYDAFINLQGTCKGWFGSNCSRLD